MPSWDPPENGSGGARRSRRPLYQPSRDGLPSNAGCALVRDKAKQRKHLEREQLSLQKAFNTFLVQQQQRCSSAADLSPAEREYVVELCMGLRRVRAQLALLKDDSR